MAMTQRRASTGGHPVAPAGPAAPIPAAEPAGLPGAASAGAPARTAPAPARRGSAPATTGGPPAPARRSQRERAEARRAEILAAAAEVFSANGFRNGSLADIAARVGITHQGVLHHFGSKERLLVEVLRARDSATGREYEQAASPKGADFLRHVLWTVTENTNRSGMVAVYAVLSAESVTDGHPAQDWFRYRYGVLRDDLAGSLADLAGPGRPIAAEEFRRAATALIAVMDGLQVQWLLEPEEVDMPAAVRATVDAFLASWDRQPFGS
jgi:AcrR family transcriptional regulator